MKFIFSGVLFLGLSASLQAQVKMSLKESITYGLQHNRTVSIYKNNRLQADQKAIQAGSAYLPNVNINAGLDDNLKLPVTVIPAGAFGANSPEQKVSFGTQFNSTQSVQLDQPIFDKAAITGLKARQPNKDYAALGEQQNNESLVYNIALAYYRVIVSQKQMQLLLENKAIIERNLEITELRAKQGVAKKIDVKQVTVNLNNINSQISTTQNSYELALNTLKFNIGLSNEESLVLSDTARWLNPENANRKVINRFDFKNTIDYKLEQTQLTLLDINRQYVKDGKYPKLSFYARYGASGNGSNIGEAYSKVYDFSTMGLKLQWNIFSGFRNNASFKLANYDYQNAQINLLLKEDQQKLMFQNADVALTRANSTIVSNKENLDLAKEVYENVNLQNRQGLASLTDLLNAENAYQQAQNNYVQSLLDFYLAEIELRKANGTLNEFYSNL